MFSCMPFERRLQLKMAWLGDKREGSRTRQKPSSSKILWFDLAADGRKHVGLVLGHIEVITKKWLGI